MGRDPIALARENWLREGWEDAADGMVAVISLMRAQQLIQARVDEALKPFELTQARYELLMLLYFSGRGSMPVKKASERLQVHPTSITNAVDRLESAGLVARSPDPHDGRATLLSLTVAGRERALAASAVLNAEVYGRSGLSERRLGTLIRALEDLRKAVGDFETG